MTIGYISSMKKKQDIHTIVIKLQTEIGLSRELLAAKLGVCSMTVYRWTKGKRTPNFAQAKLIQQIYNGYKARKGK